MRGAARSLLTVASAAEVPSLLQHPRPSRQADCSASAATFGGRTTRAGRAYLEGSECSSISTSAAPSPSRLAPHASSYPARSMPPHSRLSATPSSPVGTDAPWLRVQSALVPPRQLGVTVAPPPSLPAKKFRRRVASARIKTLPVDFGRAYLPWRRGTTPAGSGSPLQRLDLRNGGLQGRRHPRPQQQRPCSQPTAKLHNTNVCLTPGTPSHHVTVSWWMGMGCARNSIGCHEHRPCGPGESFVTVAEELGGSGSPGWVSGCAGDRAPGWVWAGASGTSLRGKAAVVPSVHC